MPGGAAPPHNMEFILILGIAVVLAYFIGRYTNADDHYEYGYADGYNDRRLDEWDDVDLSDIVAEPVKVSNNVGPERRW